MMQLWMYFLIAYLASYCCLVYIYLGISYWFSVVSMLMGITTILVNRELLPFSIAVCVFAVLHCIGLLRFHSRKLNAIKSKIWKRNVSVEHSNLIYVFSAVIALTLMTVHQYYTGIRWVWVIIHLMVFILAFCVMYLILLYLIDPLLIHHTKTSSAMLHSVYSIPNEERSYRTQTLGHYCFSMEDKESKYVTKFSKYFKLQIFFYRHYESQPQSLQKPTIHYQTAKGLLGTTYITKIDMGETINLSAETDSLYNKIQSEPEKAKKLKELEQKMRVKF